MDTPNTTTPPPAQTHAAGSHKNILMAVLAYLGILIIVSYLVAKDEPFVKFHIKQGLVLLIVEVIIWVLFPMFLWPLWGLYQILHLAMLVLVIIGIVHAAKGEEKMLPVIGDFAKHLKF